MFNRSYGTIVFGLLSMVGGSVIVYFERQSYIAYALLVVGFFSIGIGILMGFIKMLCEDNNQNS